MEKDIDTDTLISSINEVYDNRDAYILAMENAPENGAIQAICDVIDSELEV